MTSEIFIPEDIWREILAFADIKGIYQVGDNIRLNLKREKYKKIIATTYNDFIKDKKGIIVDRRRSYNKKGYLYTISIPEYKGDYILWNSNNSMLKLVKEKDSYKNDIEKLWIISKFGDWWFECHKSIYQEILISLLINK
tara:strand:+ start:632 stop:1051 length:420 start_codon:yes stop_codon:yes gene_type:complete